VVVLLHTRIDASSAPNASGKLEAVCPKGVGNGLLGADLEFSSVFLLVSLFQLCNDTLLLFGCHFPKMLLQEILGFIFGARGEHGKGSTCHSGQGKIAEKLSSCKASIVPISHRDLLSDDEVEARALGA
jgi:hypothetical protein